MEKIVKHKNLTWHHFTDNSESTLVELQKRFKFHQLDYEDILAGPQQPKVDFYDNYLFGIFHFPEYDEEAKKIQVFELDVFLSKDFLVTVAKGQSNGLEELVKKMQAQEDERLGQMEQGAAFLLYKIIDTLTDSCWPV